MKGKRASGKKKAPGKKTGSKKPPTTKAATRKAPRKAAPKTATKASAAKTKAKPEPAAPAAAGSYDIAHDERLRQLLKPLLPAGTALSPLTLDGGDYPPLPDWVELPEGLEVTRRMAKVPGVRKEQEVVFLRLPTLTATVPEDGAFDRVLRLQDALRPHGYQALLTATPSGFDYSYVFGLGTLVAHEKYAGKAMVAFFKAPEPYPLLFGRGTNGVNYGKGIHTWHIAMRLKAWAAECDCVLLGAGFDWVRMRFRTLPKDVARFVGELYLLCAEGFDESGKPLPKKLWDMPFEEQQPYAAEIGNAFGARTAADLDEYFGPNNELFLWWD